jgi:hypothetical protein
MVRPLRPKRWWPVLLVAGLIAAGATWPAAADSEAADTPEARTSIHKLVIPAAAFVPAYPGPNYVNGGDELSALSGFAGYIAPVQFPYPVVTIKSITLYAYDNGRQDFTLHLGRSRPSTGTGAVTAVVKSTGQSSTDPRAFTTTAVSARLVNSAVHGTYLALFPPPGTAYRFYGVTIRYEA